MCPVQWRKSRHVPTGPGFHVIRKPSYLIIACKHSDLACIALHWSETAGGSVPCMGAGECRYCPDPPREHCYAAAWLLNSRGTEWRVGILDLGSPKEKLANDYTPLVPVLISREKECDVRSKLIYGGPVLLRNATVPKDLAAFDVRPHLMRRWGLYDEADRIQLEAYYEQQRLAFDAAKQG